MRHRVYGRTLGRRTNHRISMFRNMAVSLFTHGQITTTVPKAKAVKPFVEKLITAAKKGDLASRRRVIAQLGGDKIMVANDEDEAVNSLRNRYGEISNQARTKAPRVVKKLFDEIAPTFADRIGGYTRIVKLSQHRIGDGSDLCVLMLVSDEDSGPQTGGKGTRKAKANRRMDFAAKLRKGSAAEEAAEATAEDAEADTVTAVADPPADEAPAEEAAAPEAEATEDEEKKDA
ncbi:MAG: 50S ribosomal protein L17 [Planctomycetota bacterium]